MGVPSYQLTTNFSANCQLTTISLANCQLATNFSQLLTFIFLQRKILHHIKYVTGSRSGTSKCHDIASLLGKQQSYSV